MKKILITGGKGQLARCIDKITKDSKGFLFNYVDLDELDITKKADVDRFFNGNTFDWCVNCAAYTAVDQAESDEDLSRQVNSDGASYLAEASRRHGIKFIQISTDFVFDGKQGLPYTETDETAPLSVYGSTKLAGEYAVAKALPEHFIIRTSWLYSEYGNNFLKTMLRLGRERDVLSVVCDQIGTPTYARDLAAAIVQLINSEPDAYGIYHFSNEGVASWYDFALAIFEESAMGIKVIPIKTAAYPTPAKRPAFSVMDKSKIKILLDLEIPQWRESLRKCLAEISSIPKSSD